MSHRGTCLILSVFLFAPLLLQAGFLDNLVKKTKESVQKSVEKSVQETVDESVDEVLNPEKGEGAEEASAEQAPQPAKGEDADEAQDADSQPAQDAGEYPTTELAIAKAVVRLAPEIFELRPEYDIKKLLLVFFPEEREINSNKFYWHKNKDALIEKAIALSADAPTSFEVAPWINNAEREPAPGQTVEDRDLEILFGEYDFEREAIPVYDKPIAVPWFAGGGKYGPALYRIVGAKPLPDVTWVDMPIEDAEQLYANAAQRRFLTHYQFTIQRVVGLENIEEHPDYEKHAKYHQMGGKAAESVKANLYPVFDIVIEDNKIDLYLPKEKDFKQGGVKPKNTLEHIATLKLEEA